MSLQQWVWDQKWLPPFFSTVALDWLTEGGLTLLNSTIWYPGIQPSFGDTNDFTAPVSRAQQSGIPWFSRGLVKRLACSQYATGGWHWGPPKLGVAIWQSWEVQYGPANLVSLKTMTNDVIGVKIIIIFEVLVTVCLMLEQNIRLNCEHAAYCFQPFKLIHSQHIKVWAFTERIIPNIKYHCKELSKIK